MPTVSQRYRQTNGRTTYDSNTALCTTCTVHRAVKIHIELMVIDGGCDEEMQLASVMRSDVIALGISINNFQFQL